MRLQTGQPIGTGWAHESTFGGQTVTERRTGILALLLWTGILILLTLLVHFAYVVWPWPLEARGIEPLRQTVLWERARVEELAAAPSLRVIGEAISFTYRTTFEWTGLDYALATSTQPPQHEANQNEAARRVSLGLRPLLETMYWSVQLLGLRMGVLLVSLPLFAVAALGGAADGVVGWYLRRTGGGRESGFLYHRAKLALWTTLFALWAVYLLPPVPVDPATIIPPFAVAVGLLTRVAIHWFKKYL